MENVEELLKIGKTGYANKTFIEKLKNAGFKVWYGKYSYWSNVPFVELENGEVIYLMKSYINQRFHTLNVDYRKRQNIIDDILKSLTKKVGV